MKKKEKLVAFLGLSFLLKEGIVVNTTVDHGIKHCERYNIIIIKNDNHHIVGNEEFFNKNGGNSFTHE